MAVKHTARTATYTVTVPGAVTRRVTYDRSAGAEARREAYAFAVELEAELVAKVEAQAKKVAA